MIRLCYLRLFGLLGLLLAIEASAQAVPQSQPLQTQSSPGSGGGGSGTVTSVTCGAGLSGGTITTTGTCLIPGGGVTAAMLASGAAASNLGYTPANRAGDILSGTFSGNPIFSGNPNFSGDPLLSGLSSITCSSGLAINSSNQIGTVACPGGGGSGTVNSGTTGQVAYYAGTGTAVSGAANMTFATGILSLGTNTSELGGVKMFGGTSGSLQINPPAVAGTASKITFPAGITDFSGTGGTSQVVKQVTTGAPFTVGQLAASDLSNGTTGSGSAVLAVSPALTGTPTEPTAAAGTNTTQAATTAFVTTAINNAIAAVNPAVAVQAATVAAGDTSALTYNNGASGIGATFTGAVNTALTIDGFTFTGVGQRLLVKNDTQSPSGAFNGIYNVTQIQTSILAPILTRALDYDQSSDINNTGAIPVVNGTANASTSWLLTSTVNTVGTDPLTFTQFSYAPAVTARLNVSQSFTAGQAVTPDTATQCGTQSAGGTMTPNLALSNSCVATFGAGNLTIANPTNMKAGQPWFLSLTEDSVGSRTVTWGTAFHWSGGTPPTLTTAANAEDDVSCWAKTSAFLSCSVVLNVK